MPSRLTCRFCHERLELRWRPAEEEVGRVRAVFDRVPYLACDDGHYRLDVAPRDYPDRVVEEAASQVHVARRPLLPWRPQRCAACSTELTMPGFRSERAVTITLEATPPYTLRLDVPLLRCTECAVENLPREAWSDAEDAILGALALRTIAPG